MKKLIDKLKIEQALTKEEWIRLFDHRDEEVDEYLFKQARDAIKSTYKNEIYVRGLIEFTNYCKNDCYYCGIRRGNRNVTRYRLTKEQILACCRAGYETGYRTFVLQGGEDPYYTDERIIDIIRSISNAFSDCTITLSIGEKPYESYKAYFEAGARRYLLRHETYLEDHYNMLHPSVLTAKERQECLYNLRKIGYQTGTGFMVGSPYQTSENLAEDMLFIKKLNPQMVGIGPFISHKQTPFKDMPSGSLKQTLFMIGVLRLMIPGLLIPSTTALGTIDKDGRILGIRCGANVIMQNVTPKEARINYTLYDNKARAGDVDMGETNPIFKEIAAAGYHVSVSQGDSLN